MKGHSQALPRQFVCLSIPCQSHEVCHAWVDELQTQLEKHAELA